MFHVTLVSRRSLILQYFRFLGDLYRVLDPSVLYHTWLQFNNSLVMAGCFIYQTATVKMANSFSQPAVTTVVLTCMYVGVLWPLEGLPQGIQWLPKLMPSTYAIVAVKAIVSKGISTVI